MSNKSYSDKQNKVKKEKPQFLSFKFLFLIIILLLLIGRIVKPLLL